MGEDSILMPHPRTKWIKKKAHAFTWAAIWWVIFFVPACFGLASAEKEARMIAGAVIIVEVLLISAAAYCWLREEKKEVSWEVD